MEHTNTTDRLLKSREVRAALGNVARSTLWRWCGAHLLPEPRVINGRPYWRQSDIQAFVAGREGETA